MSLTELLVMSVGQGLGKQREGVNDSLFLYLMNKEIMKTATIETLEEGERIFGSRTAGQYMVRFYEDGVEQAGTFCQIKEDAEVKARNWENKQSN